VSQFPITAKLSPTARNFTYLATSAIIARLGVAALRVNENKPSKNDNQQLTKNEKRQSLIERFFVEVPGTVLFTMLPLHLGQDAMNGLLERTRKTLQIPQLNDSHKLPDAEKKTINEAILKVFGTQKKGQEGFSADPHGIISRMLFGKTIYLPNGQSETIRANLSRLRKELGNDLYHKTMQHMPEMTKYGMRLNRYGCLSLMAGVLFSAFLGGAVTQRLNDNLVAPLTKRWLGQHYPDSPTTLASNAPEVLGEHPMEMHVAIPKQYSVTPPTLTFPEQGQETAFSGAAYAARRQQA
jgi:hypothetical protein